ncbi:Prostaglandin reductase 1 [Chionoecetes opilio]|uniref:Prostaglandin reductase 1 n=1 Tax=Chionoecetes opilio TaxID=41210 RepID=A0A8J5CK02_CHIOP|nr:Prostaglandin reductase 1 [Chionoecetes opilio]
MKVGGLMQWSNPGLLVLSYDPCRRWVTSPKVWARNTAYFGFLDICQPKDTVTDTVLVNGAAGVVGSAVVQIAKIKAFNYKTTEIGEPLKTVAPKGINIDFHKVGGKLKAEALPHMADFGRVSVCGAISTYSEEGQRIRMPALTKDWHHDSVRIIICGLALSLGITDKTPHTLTIVVKDWHENRHEGMGKLKYKESVVHGFDKMPSAFIGLVHGDNTGKAVVVPVRGG